MAEVISVNAGDNSLAGNWKIFKTLIKLSIPVIIELVFSTLLQYVDTAMVGHLGEKATAAVSVTTTINWLIGSIPFAFGTSFLALIARAVGSGDDAYIHRAARQALKISTLCGTIIGIIALSLSPFIPAWMGAETSVQRQASVYFFIISIPMVFRSMQIILAYVLRAVKDTRTPMFISLTENILNVILNYLLIYVANLGVTGAAVGTAISFSVSGIFMLSAVKRHKLLSSSLDNKNNPALKAVALTDVTVSSSQSISSRRNRFFDFDIPIIRECIKIGLPVLGTNITSCLGHVCFSALVSGMGTYIFAAHSIAVTAETLFYIPGYGLRTATSTLAGISLGEKNKNKLYSIEKVSVATTVLTMVLSGIILFAVSHRLMGIFTESNRVIMLGGRMLKLVAFSEPFFGLMIVFEGLYYGLGRTRYAFCSETVSMWGVRILFTFLCVKIWKFDLQAVWFCMIADNVLKAVLLSFPALVPKLRQKMLSI
ncbi:MATE family efflux transporter [Treponema parvum]|uniref:Multidrug-efflux transporter n=1 Tax=Treponema parvum TaxID=138851 RepID=A0A975IFB0_9SPIR|nr:MATE family efflux transporter [Treponema parvum]QTQ14682.1 MATE family efflux transporter [Treponema parvum]